MKIRILANLNLFPELCRREWHFTSVKMAETSSRKRARTSGGPIAKIHHSALSNSAKTAPPPLGDVHKLRKASGGRRVCQSVTVDGNLMGPRDGAEQEFIFGIWPNIQTEIWWDPERPNLN
jgi:hypothetical protein